jgi:DNA invertase Pin-like site-specific DNA recombinase
MKKSKPTPPSDATPAVAYSYIRFSTPDQAKGDSLRRQAEAAAKWCEANEVRLDTSVTLHDLGKSAFTGEHRKNPDRHALAAFLKLVETGRVPVGSFLLIENLDRLSREDEVPACHLLTGILMTGIKVVQLTPLQILTEKSNGWELMRAVMELSRGHSESKVKSERNGEAQAEKKRRARAGEPQKESKRIPAGQHAMSKRTPGWCEIKGGKVVLIHERAAVVKRIFALRAAGYGCPRIVRTLMDDGVPAFGENVVREGRKRSAFSGRWTVAYITNILKDRRALGEYQPCGKGRKPEGEPIAGYYPRVITEVEYDLARVAMPAGPRKVRDGKHVDLFAGLLTNARDQESYVSWQRSPTEKRVLIAWASKEARSPRWSFPVWAFEGAVLSCLKEIKPSEILDGNDADADELQRLGADRARIDARLAEVEQQLLSLEGDSTTLARVVKTLEERRGKIDRELADARQKAAHPLSESWGECQTLLDVIDGDDSRIRLRSLLRQVVASMHVLVVPREGQRRACAVQIRFQGKGTVRDYLIAYRRGSAQGEGRPDSWAVRSVAGDGSPLDLRDKRHVARAIARLESLDLAGFGV